MNKKKIMSLIMALVMLVGVFSPLTAFAADDDVTKTVTLHKLMMDKETLEAWDSKAIEEKGYNGKQNLEELKQLAGQIDALKEKTFSEVKDVYFAWQKVGNEKDGEKDQYIKGSLVDGVMTPTFDGDTLQFTTNIDEAFGGKTGENGIKFDTSKLKGEFKIQEISEKSSYVGKDGEAITDSKAVPVEITLPLINNDGPVTDAHVYPKNTQERPEIDKNFKYGKDKANVVTEAAEGAGPEVGANYDNSAKDKAKVSSELGKKIPYEVKTQIPQNAKYKKLVWDDQMQKGLVYNRDLEISGVDGLVKGTDYKLYETDRGFRLVFQDSGLTKVENAAKNGVVDITLTYSAHLDGTVKPDEEKENNVTFDYSNKPGFENEPTETTPSEGKITVEKTWAADGKEITEADRHVKAVFTLQEKQEDGSWKDVAVHESNYKEGFTHTFEGLDNNKTYRVVESVSGYEPEYQKTTEDGKVVIVNKIDNDNPKTLKPTNPKVVNGGKKFVKTNQDGSERLAGAQFIVLNEAGTQYLVAKSSTEQDAQNIDVKEKKTALDNAIEAYNDLSAEEQKGEAGKTAKAAIDKAQKEYNDAVKEAAKAYDWVDLPANLEDKKAPEGAVVLTSDSQGKFEITGLEYGKYNLKEIVPPAGFAKLNGNIEFVVGKDSYNGPANGLENPPTHKGYESDADTNKGQQIENKKVTIPQTGGMGTVLFTIVGISLMAGAVVAMKRNREEA